MDNGLIIARDKITDIVARKLFKLLTTNNKLKQNKRYLTQAMGPETIFTDKFY